MNKLVPFPLAVFATDAECADWLRDRLAQREQGSV
ncbi:hypothetical protein SAMN04489726_7895 [Allokutzneria albata]|uniref:Uncharacterized protein n=1 Tax=Allokutzneria albata TaxID=211114 RepID=A0A1H0DN73_ALLAB|nr:hypothetical protein SAMN04489726_7895 [Allokutzneria albata]